MIARSVVLYFISYTLLILFGMLPHANMEGIQTVAIAFCMGQLLDNLFKK